MLWRWDQGRSDYFKFEAILNIAPILMQYNAADMKLVDSSFRTDIMNATGLPFAPSSYTIKRNYKRVFECMLLASFIGQRLIISDIGRAIANNDPYISNVDSYLFEVARRFRYPYPAFNNYNNVRSICFPFLAVLKLLFSRAILERNSHATISLLDVGTFLIANDVSGLEDLAFYKMLKPKPSFTFNTHGSSDQKRQVREMMHFIGQHTFLYATTDELSIKGLTIEECHNAFDSLKPYDTDITSNTPIDDFLKITKYQQNVGLSETTIELENFSVQEGKKVFKSHFCYERSPQLRKEFITRNPIPICDVCGKNMHIIYPWTENMLEIHHINPLSLQNDTRYNHTTNFSDIVGICPSCHRAIHLYYKNYLIKSKLPDFETEAKAKEIYNQAKSIVRNHDK